MTVESLMQTCAELGIKLTLKSDDNDRLLVDAPKGTLTAALREALTANKPDLIAYLKEQATRRPKAPTAEHDSEVTESRTPARTPSNPPEATFLIREQHLSTTPPTFERANAEVDKLLSGSDYDAGVIDSKDSGTRQIISAQLLTALAGRDFDRHGPARRAFMSHGYFDDATMQLRTADSPAERAAAARKLGVAQDVKATVYLIAALNDGAPEVRRAATESLGQIGDPSAIAPLNEFLLRETSRQLPEAVIRHAINSIAVAEARRSPVAETPALRVAETPVVKTEPEKPRVETPAAARETLMPKREIFAEYLSSFEPRTPLSSSEPTIPNEI